MANWQVMQTYEGEQEYVDYDHVERFGVKERVDEDGNSSLWAELSFVSGVVKSYPASTPNRNAVQRSSGFYKID